MSKNAASTSGAYAISRPVDPSSRPSPTISALAKLIDPDEGETAAYEENRSRGERRRERRQRRRESKDLEGLAE